jgi:hypothetical protein
MKHTVFYMRRSVDVITTIKSLTENQGKKGFVDRMPNIVHSSKRKACALKYHMVIYRSCRMSCLGFDIPTFG